jgi:hypothetical protein
MARQHVEVAFRRSVFVCQLGAFRGLGVAVATIGYRLREEQIDR